ncbi:hypothetical protein [Streptosporangium saharense]|uniref:Uncharacterized protein n=1 Tax=Streptosporangium saharense TaxID=1706840 RepID=A0A7W7QRL8_9ACTN|nr:hypothetical protein [Streptosporangium saharense]MBB4918490.1 hypothetical protein [Streptosporangium saharense]
MSMYGRDESTWDLFVEAGLEFLIEVARQGGATTYTDLNAALVDRTGLPGFDFERIDERAAIGYLLGRIVEVNRPETGWMISALVLHKDSPGPGAGFFNLAIELELLTPKPSFEQKIELWKRHYNGVHDHYRNRRITSFAGDGGESTAG